MDELVEQPTRRRILEDIAEHPGTSGREVQARLSLGWGATAYHLERMVSAGALRRERGGHRDYYFAPDITWADRRLIQSLTSPTQRALLVAISDAPSITFRELCARVDAGRSTVSFHLARLVEIGTVEVIPTGAGKTYRVPQADRLRALLTAHRASWGDSLVESLAESLAGLAAPDRSVE